MVTGIAGVAEGVLDMNEQISCEYEYVIVNEDGTRIEQNAPRCHVDNLSQAHSKHANQTLVDAIRNSCNYYFCEVAYRLGIERLYDWAEAFGLTSPTNIELTGEATGIVGKQDLSLIHISEPTRH